MIVVLLQDVLVHRILRLLHVLMLPDVSFSVVRALSAVCLG
jgi:hypothetical protein